MHQQFFKKTIVSLLCILISFPILAADVVPGVAQQQVMDKMLIGLMILTILVALIAMGWVMDILIKVQRMRLLQEHGVEGLEKVGIKVKTEPLWQQWYKKLTKTVPVEREREILLDHNYDGIRELDNQLPPWWVATFYITIVFGVFYLGYNHFSDYGISQEEEYAQQMEQAEASIKAYLATQADQVDESNVEAILDQDQLALGATLFQASCAVCHGASGEGGTGPNLTDDYWIHGGDIKHIFSTIKYGVPEKGMIAWKAQLRPSDMQRISSYILTLRGSNPPNAKEAQGEIWTFEVEDLESEEEQSTEKVEDTGK